MHYFTNDQVKSNRKIKQIIIKKGEYTFITDNGVFSKKGLDFGTRTLLECLPLDKLYGSILDFGCGYGPIGIFISKNTKLLIDMVDINKRSLLLAQENAKLNKVQVNIFESNIYSKVSKKYDFIITNPPIRVGKEILYKILFEAQQHLKPHGELWLVVNKNQGAKTIYKELQKIYKVEIVKKNRFDVFRAIND